MLFWTYNLIKGIADITKTVRRALSLENLYLHWYFLKGGLVLESQGGACQLGEVQAQMHIADGGERDSHLLYVSLVSRTLTWDLATLRLFHPQLKG